MPLPLTVSCFSKIQTGFTFLVPAHLGSPGKGPLNRCELNRCVRMARSKTFESRVLTTVWSGSVMELLSDKRSLWLEGLWQDVGFERGLEGWEVITRSCFHCWLPWWPWQCSIETVSPSCPLASAQTSSRRSSSSLLSENTCTHTLQWSTSVWLQCKRTQVQASLRAVVLITTAAAIYSLGHGLHILTAVPRLTQPSTPRGMAKKYQFLD